MLRRAAAAVTAGNDAGGEASREGNCCMASTVGPVMGTEMTALAMRGGAGEERRGSERGRAQRRQNDPVRDDGGLARGVFACSMQWWWWLGVRWGGRGCKRAWKEREHARFPPSKTRDAAGHELGHPLQDVLTQRLGVGAERECRGEWGEVGRAGWELVSVDDQAVAGALPLQLGLREDLLMLLILMRSKGSLNGVSLLRLLEQGVESSDFFYF